jgi:TetR/AcrR family transcriptional regulator, transcriptional repressor for nem operon
MGLFRTRGFAATSADVLVRELGISRHSLYAEFGSKQGLFDAALRRYDESVLERNFGPLERAGAGVAEIRALLLFFGEAHAGPAAGRGCLLCNTAVEFGPDDPSGQGFVQAYFSRVSQAFRGALRAARDRGEVRTDVEPETEAAFFTASILGMFVMIRAEAPAVVLEQASAAAVAHLESLRA